MSPSPIDASSLLKLAVPNAGRSELAEDFDDLSSAGTYEAKSGDYRAGKIASRRVGINAGA